ncbi:hypothetical protein CK203_082196 [Vitis vinifera]|uniref:Uncharacterized protein n=1 Tax=Vitis vinifera TaxID=29760 RepID=A0A438CN64_VITVI|nr:hypothetical protein CK203_082196 [Vitis vinifera]
MLPPTTHALKFYGMNLKDFQPVLVCNCGGMKTWMESRQMDHVIKFLIGLNDSYSQVRAQILMMDPIPPIAKTFALVVQEERLRNIKFGILPPPEPIAFNAKNQPPSVINSVVEPKCERPLCTHCGLLGDTIDKYYKIHG